MRTLFRLLARRFPTPAPVSVFRPEQPGADGNPFGRGHKEAEIEEQGALYRTLRSFLEAHRGEWGFGLATQPSWRPGTADLLLFAADHPEEPPAAIFRVTSGEEADLLELKSFAARGTSLVFLVRELPHGGPEALSQLVGDTLIPVRYVGSPGDRFHFLWSDLLRG